MKNILFALLLTSLGSFASAQLTVAGFTGYDLHGFRVLVNTQALSSHPAESQAAINYLDTLLFRVTEIGFAPDILDSLRKVPIFMERAFNNGGAWYHYGTAWLIQNGLNPAKGSAVEITNMNNFVNWSRLNQPMIIMHELTHAYHHRVLGLNYPGVLNAYQAAVNSGAYNAVPYNPGGGAQPFNQPAYALTDNREYFAEITEAYLGRNDYFPFDSTDLRTFDPLGYQVAKTVWRFEGANRIEDDLTAPWQVRLFPNPAQDRLFIEANSAQVLAVSLSDMWGRQMGVYDLVPSGLEIDLSALPAGPYCLTVSGGNYLTRRTVIRR